MPRWVVWKHDSRGHHPEAIAFRDTQEEALAVANELRDNLSSEWSKVVTFEVRPARPDRPAEHVEEQPRSQVDTANYQAPHAPQNCDDIKNEVAKKPFRPGERAYLIKKAIELGCTDSIPDSWSIEFSKEP